MKGKRDQEHRICLLALAGLMKLSGGKREQRKKAETRREGEGRRGLRREQRETDPEDPNRDRPKSFASKLTQTFRSCQMKQDQHAMMICLRGPGFKSTRKTKKKKEDDSQTAREGRRPPPLPSDRELAALHPSSLETLGLLREESSAVLV